MDQQNPRDAAAISYFILFALFPAVLVLLAVASDILAQLEIRLDVTARIMSLFPVSKDFLEKNLSQIAEPSPALVLSCVMVVLWTSTWIFSFVENALNRAWGVPKQRTFWESRIRSFIVVFLGGTILLASAGITAVVSKAQSRTSAEFKQDEIITGLWSSIFLSVGFLLAILVFFCVFKLMPDRKVAWREALSGALASALLWELGSIIFLRLGTYFDYERVYGRMGAVIALLAWVYTSNMIMLFGASFSAQLHRPPAEQSSEGENPDRGKEEREGPGGEIRSVPNSR